MSVLERISRKDSELEMTPMIDVTFLLLIFFMCTIKFKTLEGKLSAFLPQDVGLSTAEAEKPEKIELEIRVLRAGTRLDPVDAARKQSRDPHIVAAWRGAEESRYIFAEDRLLEYRVGPRSTTDLDDLLSKLQRAREFALEQSQETPALTIDPGPGTIYEDVVHVLDRAVMAEFVDVSFVGAHPD